MALKSGTSDRRQQCVVHRRPNQLFRQRTNPPWRTTLNKRLPATPSCHAVASAKAEASCKDGSTLNRQLSRNLLDNFLELRAEDVHASIVVKVSPERDV